MTIDITFVSVVFTIYLIGYLVGWFLHNGSKEFLLTAGALGARIEEASVEDLDWEGSTFPLH